MKHTIIILLSLTLYSNITIAGLNSAEKRIILDDIKNISKEKIIDTSKVNNEYWGNGLWSSAIHYAAEKLSEWMENEVANAIGIVAQMNRQQKNTCANTKDIPCWRSFWKNTPTKPWLDLYNTLRRPDVKDRLSKFNIYIK